MPALTRASAIAFADQLRFARHTALGDAEGFDEIIYAVERLGSYLTKEKLGDKGDYGSLSKYTAALAKLAAKSGLALYVPNLYRHLLTPFDQLYKLVSAARNDAMHQGAFARHLTVHAIELAIILEDALTKLKNPTASDFMVRNPVCAELWQPVGLIRQQMLVNSYSYLPVLRGKQWYLISDAAIAIYLGAERGGPDRRKRLASTLEDAFPKCDFKLTEPKPDSTSLTCALEALGQEPVLLIYRSPDESATGPAASVCSSETKRTLAGLLTPFDLL